jgi:hypothetical protein
MSRIQCYDIAAAGAVLQAEGADDERLQADSSPN